MALELVVLIGLQASGKTTFFRSRYALTHVHVSKDNFPNNRRPERRQQELVEQALADGRSVVLDNTSPTKAGRGVVISAARAAGARVVGYYFESRVQECLERNALRDAKRRVPEVAIFSTIKALERPAMSEGFDELFYVRCAEEGGFVVEAWKSEEGEAGGAGPV